MRYTPGGKLFTEIVLEVFRLNGTLVAAGNRLGAGVGLTSARWQVIGAIVLAGEPLTVAQIGRAMGLTRQSVQRVVDELERDGLVRRSAHPESRRARLVALTAAGESAYAKVTDRQRPWANATAKGLTTAHLTAVLNALQQLRSRLTEGEDHDSASRAG